MLGSVGPRTILRWLGSKIHTPQIKGRSPGDEIPRMTNRILSACLILGLAHSSIRADDKDWPSYNRDETGHRHNRGETAIGPANAGQLVEKWRYPAEGSGEQIGVIHGTPIVVDGCVYFATATAETFYKLGPDGKLKWSYRNPGFAELDPTSPTRFNPGDNGVLCSAVVTKDSVYFGDMAAWFYCLDRATGKERWKINSRAKDFPGTHPLNWFVASPIIADGKLIVAGGCLEQIAGIFPGYKSSTGRGYVMALEPATGKILWKYDVGAKPEPFDPPITITDSWGTYKFVSGPASSTVWCTPSFDPETGTIFFGTDVNTAPRRPTKDNPKLATEDSCAVIAIDVHDGKSRWVRQLNPGDVWTNAMRAYDPKTGLYKDQSIGDTPKVYSIPVDGKPTKVVGVGCKNGGFYVIDAGDGKIIANTPIYTGAPKYPLNPKPDPRMLALPSPIGGLQTGCATDGKSIFTNGIDTVQLGTQDTMADSGVPPTGGRVVSISLDSRSENWRHDRPKVASLGGPKPKPVFTNVGDPVASGIAVANGVIYFTTVASGKLMVLEAKTGKVLKEFDVGPVWSGPSVSRGRVYVGTGNTQFAPSDGEAFFPKKYTGVLHSFGLPGEDEVSRLGAGRE